MANIHVGNNDMISPSSINATPIENSHFSTTLNNPSNKKIYQNIFFYFSFLEISITTLLTLASPFVMLSLFMAIMTEGFSNLTLSFHTLLFFFFVLVLICYPISCIGSIYLFYKHSKNRDIFCYKQLIESSVAIFHGLLIVAFYYILWV